jgi:hypothetical protein
MECTLDSERNPFFKLLKPYLSHTKMSERESGKVLDHNIWLLEETQEPMEASQSREREIKRIRLSGNLAKKIDALG